ncbi:MAG: protein tyrosine phosphatase family protein [Candidatus Tectimicrobiota bacterium]
MASTALTTIYNMLELAPDLGTSGQPTSAQLATVQEAGYEVVINLATGATPRDLPNEAAVVAAHGMDYIHIPVIWEHPTTDDLQRFFAAMEATQGKKRFVHCIANMRVSAFVFLYRVLRQGVPLEEARASLAQIWQPNPVWQQFIDEALARGQCAQAEQGVRP